MKVVAVKVLKRSDAQVQCLVSQCHSVQTECVKSDWSPSHYRCLRVSVVASHQGSVIVCFKAPLSVNNIL